MKTFAIILFCFSGLGIYSQNQIKQPVMKNIIAKDSIKPKNKPLLKQVLDSVSKVDIEIAFDSLQFVSEEKLKPFKTNAATSYYADKFNGRKTASGQIFDNKKLTAAHKTLPFGTKLKVTNQANGKSVVVTVNDRGPFTKGRELDLSKAAFLEITRDIRYGIMHTTIEIIEE